MTPLLPPLPLLHRTTRDSPMGELLLAASADALCGVWFADQPGIPDWARAAPEDPRQELLREALSQLDAYFAGRRRDFSLPLQFGGSDFQRQVWRALASIPHGGTQTYGELARSLGRPTAARAVGSAVGSNPLLIVLPCHRVVGGAGRLSGYAGGVERKRWLLAHEGALPR